jgi:hypothetical protein
MKAERASRKIAREPIIKEPTCSIDGDSKRRLVNQIAPKPIRGRIAAIERTMMSLTLELALLFNLKGQTTRRNKNPR